MRITFPNPLGPPISIDTTRYQALNSHLSTATPVSTLARKTPFRIACVMLVCILLYTFRPAPPFPPNYSEEWRRERNLPWLYESREGDGRYLMFEPSKPTGFNHQLQRVLLQHHLAVLSNRSYAFQPLIQDETSLPFVFGGPPWRSARVPLSALISTATSGFEASYDSRRATPLSRYRSICPPMKQKVYSLRSDEHPDGNLEVSREGQERIHQLQVLFAGSDESCLRIEGQIFDDVFFDSQAPLHLYSSFAQSPVLKHFSFAAPVLSILNKHLPQLAPDSPPYNVDTKPGQGLEPIRKQPWKHILALHLRRGDAWEQVCEEKGKRAAPFVAFNKLPNLPGNENVPPPEDMVEAARMGLYRAKCLPETLEVIARARRMRKNHPFLKNVYILTDDDSPWVEEIRMWLLSEGWEKVWVGKADLWSDWQDREIGVGVDMEVARRAGVFVGNGFSTTSSNIVLLRSRDGIHPDLTQFW